MSIDLRKLSWPLVFMRSIYGNRLYLDDADILWTNLITDMIKFMRGSRSQMLTEKLKKKYEKEMF